MRLHDERAANLDMTVLLCCTGGQIYWMSKVQHNYAFRIHMLYSNVILLFRPIFTLVTGQPYKCFPRSGQQTNKFA